MPTRSDRARCLISEILFMRERYGMVQKDTICKSTSAFADTHMRESHDITGFYMESYDSGKPVCSPGRC